ncbi:MAG: 2-phosphosulfolactate phosphatase [Bacillota bacterium]|nr:2-phosphosulfolactate phosphatase [Bacillota bacterium]
MSATAGRMDVRLVTRREEIEPRELEGRAAVVIDTLRATTSIATALAAGAAWVLPVDSEEAAWTARRALQDPAGQPPLLAGERERIRIPGFDLGNSPAEFTPGRVGGRGIVLFTTNGSRALHAAAPRAARLYCAALVNAGAVAGELLRTGAERLTLICSGSGGRFSVEDFLTAGCLIDRLHAATGDAPGEEGWEGVEALAPGRLRLDDAAEAAWLAWRAGRRRLRALVEPGRAARALAEVGLADDLDDALRLDSLGVIPIFREGRVVALDGPASQLDAARRDTERS